ncbi:MAG: substrate-binding domain-containing protein [Gemmatimonadetes bacterium]|nr:substrate-binding domain-containing protein [Gemmatimonadota bacterium]
MAGAEQAGAELAAAGDCVTLIWKGPLCEDSRDQQVQVVEGFTSQHVDGMVWPRSTCARCRVRSRAQAAGVPTVIIDSGLESDAIVSYVATDNTKGGELAADRLGELLGGKGKVLVLRLQEGSASTTAREDGFWRSWRRSAPGSPWCRQSIKYAGATRARRPSRHRRTCSPLWRRPAGSSPPTNRRRSGCCSPCRTSARRGKIRFVGFDATQVLIDAMKAGSPTGSPCRTRCA